jgi:hypothetical protein
MLVLKEQDYKPKCVYIATCSCAVAGLQAGSSHSFSLSSPVSKRDWDLFQHAAKPVVSDTNFLPNPCCWTVPFDVFSYLLCISLYSVSVYQKLLLCLSSLCPTKYLIMYLVISKYSLPSSFGALGRKGMGIFFLLSYIRFSHWVVVVTD